MHFKSRGMKCPLFALLIFSSSAWGGKIYTGSRGIIEQAFDGGRFHIADVRVVIKSSSKTLIKISAE